MVIHDTSGATGGDHHSHATAVVVGAGYAGLFAALALQEEGIDVLVLEGSDRVGGRVLSEAVGENLVIDHGGQWVGPTQRHLLAAAQRFGCETFPTYDTGTHLELWVDGTCRPFRGAAPEDGPGASGYEAAIELIDAMATTVNLDNPTATTTLAEWDGQTVESFFEKHVPDPAARLRLALSVQGVWATEPRDISLFHFLFYVAAAGGYAQLMGTEGCAQAFRFLRGAQSVALAMAAHLGDRIRLGAAVRHIRHDGPRVEIDTDDGTVTADHVVVTVAPSAAVRLRFTPKLPHARRRWMERNPMGDVAKIHTVYDTPFWRERGLSGQAAVYGDPAVGVVFDNSPADANAGVLVSFVYGERLHRWSELPAEQRRAEVLGLLETLFGAEAGAPSRYTEKIWPGDAWAGGGYAANPTPGTWTEHGVRGWRSAAGRIHWAGTETAEIWNGYIDGAISSGQRAAAEVRTALGADAK